jgi:hypothetical protein
MDSERSYPYLNVLFFFQNLCGAKLTFLSNSESDLSFCRRRLCVSKYKFLKSRIIINIWTLPWMKWIFFAGRICTFLYETISANLYKWLILRLSDLQMIPKSLPCHAGDTSFKDTWSYVSLLRTAALGLLCDLSLTSNFRHQASPRVSPRESTQRWKVELWMRNVREFCLNADFHVTFRDSVTCRKAPTWDRRLYFPSEGRRAEDFFTLKIRRLWPDVNPRTWVPNANTLTLDSLSRSPHLNRLDLFSTKSALRETS